MGQRANFEDEYSGETLCGSYVAGVYYPDKTRVGWWKHGYPEYFAKVLNAPNWIGIHISIDNQKLDLAKCKVEDFRRVLDMKAGLLMRSFVATLPDGKKIQVCTGMRYFILEDGHKITGGINLEERDKFAGNVVQLDLQEGNEVVFELSLREGLLRLRFVKTEQRLPCNRESQLKLF